MIRQPGPVKPGVMVNKLEWAAVQQEELLSAALREHQNCRPSMPAAISSENGESEYHGPSTMQSLRDKMIACDEAILILKERGMSIHYSEGSARPRLDHVY